MTNQLHSDKKQELSDVIFAVAIPTVFVLLLWIVYFIGNSISYNIALLGVHPLDVKGLL